MWNDMWNDMWNESPVSGRPLSGEIPGLADRFQVLFDSVISALNKNLDAWVIWFRYGR